MCRYFRVKEGVPFYGCLLTESGLPGSSAEKGKTLEIVPRDWVMVGNGWKDVMNS